MGAPPSRREAIDAIIRLCEDKTENTKEGMAKRFFSMEEAEHYTGLGRCTLSRAAKAGMIEIFKLSPARSGKLLLLKSSIDSWIESRRIEPQE